MTGAIEYAQARMQARHGARATEPDWMRVHAAVTLAALIETARASALSPWVSGLDAASPARDLEQELRERLRRRIAEVAVWMPRAWRPAVLWTRELIDLPAAQRSADDEERALRMRQEWTAKWRALWPRSSAEDRAALEALVAAVEAHLARFAQAAVEDAWSLRRELQARVESLFRRDTLTPAAAFAHLLLLALELERLRAEIALRARWTAARPAEAA